MSRQPWDRGQHKPNPSQMPKAHRRKRKALPDGLSEFEATLDDLAFTEGLLKRLLDLPEQGFQRDMECFADAMKVAKGAEQAAANAREAARRIARRIWAAAKSNWSVEELKKATGYDEE